MFFIFVGVRNVCMLRPCAYPSTETVIKTFVKGEQYYRHHYRYRRPGRRIRRTPAPVRRARTSRFGQETSDRVKNTTPTATDRVPTTSSRTRRRTKPYRRESRRAPTWSRSRNGTRLHVGRLSAAVRKKTYVTVIDRERRRRA